MIMASLVVVHNLDHRLHLIPQASSNYNANLLDVVRLILCNHFHAMLHEDNVYYHTSDILSS